MLKKLLKTIEDLKAAQQVNITERLESFQDTFAQTIEWSPKRSGGANFKTHKLVTTPEGNLVIKSTLGFYLFRVVFLLMGLLVMVVSSPTLQSLAVSFFEHPLYTVKAMVFSLPHAWRGEAIYGALFGAVFFFLGIGMLLFARKGGTFRVLEREYTRPKHPPIPFGNIHAIQIISEHCTSGGKHKSHYYSYELNLVLKDHSRITVLDHGNRDCVQEDAATIAQSIGIPVWSLV